MTKFKKIKKNFLNSKFFIIFLYTFLKIYLFTIRIKIENEEILLNKLNSGESVILCTWHQQFFVLIKAFKKYRVFSPSIMISQSKDGDIVSYIAKKRGWNVVRGSSSRGGKNAKEILVKKIQKNKLALHIVDGPRGPIGKIKNGLIKIAIQTEALIVPIYVVANKVWLASSWDKFMIPKPFSKVTIIFDNQIDVGEITSDIEFEKKRQEIEERMRPYIKL